MKIIAIIPARYGSSRFPGKPLVDICGKPMVWWVYNQAIKAALETYVATDDKRIADVCKQNSIPHIMTSYDCGTSTERVYEVAQKIIADIYIVINGDEPLIGLDIINAVIPKSRERFFAANLMTEIKNPVEVVDSTNIKVVTDENDNALFMSRNPIPYPKSNVNYKYYKHVGVLAYTFEALKFFAETPKGYNEQIEDINELRFIEHGKSLKMIKVSASSLSVDTPKDLEYVRTVVQNKINRGEIKL
jgi:3-deoxy-manno-octulosonate cytidylyltransferase (CMP-KDO synthetase)